MKNLKIENMRTIYFLSNPENREDQICITQMDDDYWVARRYTDPRMNVATLRNWKDNPLFATYESWNFREGQRDFWNKALRNWDRSSTVVEDPPTDSS